MSSTLGEIALALSNATVFPDVIAGDIGLGVCGSNNSIRVGGPARQASTMQVQANPPGLAWYRYDNQTVFFQGQNNIAYFNTQLPNASGATSVISGLYGDNGLAQFGISGYGANVALKIVGYFLANVTGTWTFNVCADDICDMWLGANALAPTVGNALIATDFNSYPGGTAATMSLTAGQLYPLLMYWGQTFGGGNFNFSFTPPSGTATTNGSGYYFQNPLVNVSGTLQASNVALAGKLTSTSTFTASNIVIAGTLLKNGAQYVPFASVSSNVCLLGGSNLGIGTATPAVPLDVAGYINASVGIQQGGSNLSFLPLTGTADSTYASNNQVTVSNLGYSGWVSTSSNVTTPCVLGIGTTTTVATPYAADIAMNGGTGAGLVLIRNGALGSTGTQMLFGYSNTPNYRHAITSRHATGGGVSNAIDITLWDSNVASTALQTGVPDMSITPVGVGINNSNPIYPLDVIGTGHITSNLITPNANIGDCGLGATYATFANINCSTTTGYALMQTSAGATTVNSSTTAAYGIIIGAGAARTCMWTPTGLGVGTQTPAYKLDVYGSNVRIANPTAQHSGIVLANSCNALSVVEQQSVGSCLPNETILNMGQNTGNMVPYPSIPTDTAYFQIDTRATSRKFSYFAGLSNTASSIMNLTYPSGNLSVAGPVYCVTALTVAAPSVGVSGGTGDRFVLYPGTASTYPYSLGINGGTLWFSTGAGGSYQWWTGGTLSMATSNNCLGIGTSNPVRSLDVAGGTVLVRNGASAVYSSSNQLQLGYSASTSYAHTISTRHNSGGGVGNSIDISLWNNTAAVAPYVNTVAMSVTAAGVGINNSNPAYTLDVAGKAHFSTGINGPTWGCLLLRAYDDPGQTRDFRGRPLDYQPTNYIDYYNTSFGGKSTNYCVRICGYIRPTSASRYFFKVVTDAGVRMWINDQLVVNSWQANSSATFTTPAIRLESTAWYPIIIEHYQDTGNQQLTVTIAKTSDGVTPQTYMQMSWSNGGPCELCYDMWESSAAQRFGRMIVSGSASISGNLNCQNVYRSYLMTGSVANGGPTMWLNFANNGVDASGNGNNATLAGTVATQGQTLYTLSGKTFVQLSFPNTGTSALTTSLNPTAGAKTMSFWVYTARATSATDNLGIGFFGANTTGAHFTMLFHSEMGDLFPWGYGNDIGIGGSSTVQWANTSSWHHVVYTMDITNMCQVYIDGNPVSKYWALGACLDYNNVAIPNPKIRMNPTTTSQTFRIINYGNQQAVGYWFRNILYYTRCLTAGEVSSLYYNT